MATPILSSSFASLAPSDLLRSREDRMLKQLELSQSERDSAKVEKGSREFEAILLGTWLQQAEQSMATVPGAENDEDAAGREQMMSLGVQSISNSLAGSGGIGIAQMIARAMYSAAHYVGSGSSDPPKNTGNEEN